MDMLFDGLCSDISEFNELTVVKIICRIILVCVACDSISTAIHSMLKCAK